MSNAEMTQQEQDEAVLESLYRRIRYACLSEAAYLVEQLGAEGYNTKFIAQAVLELAEK